MDQPGGRPSSAQDIIRSLRTDPVSGLASGDAAARLRSDGANELPPPPQDGWLARLGHQLRDPMALLLIGAAAVSGLGLRERLDAAAILAIVVLNAAIGLAEEGKAAGALAALRSMETPTARVRRSGHDLVIEARDLVPGDLVLLSAGDRVPADLRLLDAAALEVDESLLTGESLPVPKDPSRTGAEAADRPEAALSGTLVTRGFGRGIVVATGAETALGRIAGHLRLREPVTPLQEELGRLTGRLGAIAVVIAAAVFGLALVRTGATPAALERSFLSAVALAVAAVPEGLATVVTVALALGVRRMAAQGAIVRRLPAVETLGQATVILTDKTGTLTENRMRVESVALPDADPVPPSELPPAARGAVEEVAALCNDATTQPPAGDPLEVALLDAVGPRASSLRERRPRLAQIPFDSERKRMTTVHGGGAGALLLVKGAPEAVLERCSAALTPEGGEAPLREATRDSMLRLTDDLAARGARVLALAARTLADPPDDLEAAERDLTIVGLVGLRDPVRPSAAGTVAGALEAGVRPIMVTGDHAGTAAAIGTEVGVLPPGTRVLTGADLRRDGLPSDPLEVRAYARVDPDQKLALVEALRKRGEVVAVTGDGVNDAPALRRADIGVAMGRAGSDVAREAGDMVVTDDDLATIVAAVREGRGIYDNIRKVVDYLVAGNLSEIAVVIVSLLLFPSLGVPLLPLQLLWVNLLTDGLPAIALGTDPVDPTLMHRPPRPRGERLLAGRRIALLSGRGALIAASAVGSLAVARFLWDEPWAHARAVMFTVLVTAHLLYAFAVRAPTVGLLANRRLLLAVGGGLALQLLIVSWPAAQPLFGTAPLTAREWALVAGSGVLPVAILLVMHAIRHRV